MNFYSFHPGDYTLRTAHLEPLEDLAYRRLLDLYYLNEGPLAGTPDELARVIRMRQSADEVKAVLEEFFQLSEAGWQHSHCDEVIAKYHAKAKQAATNGKAGGRPKKPSDNPEETQPVISGLPGESGSKTNQEPETNNQEPVDQEHLSPTAPATGAEKPGRKKSCRFDPLTAKPANIGTTAWADFCAHRHKKSALTEKACELIAKKLATHHDPEAVLYRSIENGWTGIFPEQVTHEASPSNRGTGRLSAVDAVKHAIAAREAAEAEPGLAGQAVAEDGGTVRTDLDGEFRRVG